MHQIKNRPWSQWWYKMYFHLMNLRFGLLGGITFYMKDSVFITVIKLFKTKILYSYLFHDCCAQTQWGVRFAHVLGRKLKDMFLFFFKPSNIFCVLNYAKNPNKKIILSFQICSKFRFEYGEESLQHRSWDICYMYSTALIFWAQKALQATKPGTKVFIVVFKWDWMLH